MKMAKKAIEKKEIVNLGHGTGRRKTSVARVYLREGSGVITVNGKPLEEYFADAVSVLQELEQAGAAAVGFNCVAADVLTPSLVSRLRRYVKGPLICKPNAGIPVIDDSGIAVYSQSPEEFSGIMAQCAANGANLLGGCCGTEPKHIHALASIK